MKQQIEKIYGLALRGIPAVEELEQLLEGFDDMATKARMTPMLYEQNKKLKEQIEVFEASNRIKAANVENLEKELAELKLHKEYDQTLDALIAERDALLAEREAMMKQEPVAVVIETTDAINIAIEQNGATGLQSMKAGDYVYRYPLPAQQIPEGWKVKKRIIAGTEIEEIILTSPEDFHVAFRCYEDSDFGHPKNVIFRYFSQLSASQPKGDM